MSGVYSSILEHLVSIHKALGLIPSTTNNPKPDGAVHVHTPCKWGGGQKDCFRIKASKAKQVWKCYFL